MNPRKYAPYQLKHIYPLDQFARFTSENHQASLGQRATPVELGGVPTIARDRLSFSLPVAPAVDSAIAGQISASTLSAHGDRHLTDVHPPDWAGTAEDTTHAPVNSTSEAADAAKLLVSVEEACVLLSVRRTTLYALLRGRRGQARLLSVKLGSRRLIPLAALQAFVSELMEQECVAYASRELRGAQKTKGGR